MQAHRRFQPADQAHDNRDSNRARPAQSCAGRRSWIQLAIPHASHPLGCVPAAAASQTGSFPHLFFQNDYRSTVVRTRRADLASSHPRSTSSCCRIYRCAHSRRIMALHMAHTRMWCCGISRSNDAACKEYGRNLGTHLVHTRVSCDTSTHRYEEAQSRSTRRRSQ